MNIKTFKFGLGYQANVYAFVLKISRLECLDVFAFVNAYTSRHSGSHQIIKLTAEFINVYTSRYSISYKDIKQTTEYGNA